MEEWLRSSWYFQQSMFKNVKDRYWAKLEEANIINDIKFALCICYGEKYLKTKPNDLVEKISKRIFEHYSVDNTTDKTRYFSCTFLNIWLIDDKKESTECVFWTKHKNTGTEICIDTNCRNYKNWEDFTKNNVLPKSYLIFPVAGRYSEEDRSDSNYKELICQKSVACGLKSKVKTFLDVGALVGTLAGASVLAFNPVSLPVTVTAAATSVIGGAVNTGFAVERLVDNVEHEKMGYKTVFAVSDIVISAVGAVAVGVTSGCKVLGSTEKFLCNSAMLIKIGSTTATVCKAVTAVNGINVFIKAIVEYKVNGSLGKGLLLYLKLTINFIFLICVSLPLVERLVQYMSRHSLDSIVNSLINQSRIFKYVKTGTSILNDLESLIQRVCPRELQIMKRITESPFVKFVHKVINNIKQRGTKDPLNLIYDMMNQLPVLLKEFDEYFLQSKQQIANNHGEETGEFIKKWALNEGISVGNEQSSTEDKFSLPVHLIDKVNKTLLALNVIENENCLIEKRFLLLNAVMKFIFQCDLKTFDYAIGKANYYCDQFSEIFTKLMDNIYCEHFLNTYKNISDDTTNLVTLELDSKNIEFMFNKTLELLYKSNNDLHYNYELCSQKSTRAVSSEGTGSVFKFKVPKTDLNEKLCYDIAVKRLPLKLTKDSYKFECHFDQLAIISSNDDNFKLIFYVNEDGEYLDGLFMYIK